MLIGRSTANPRFSFTAPIPGPSASSTEGAREHRASERLEDRATRIAGAEHEPKEVVLRLHRREDGAEVPALEIALDDVFREHGDARAFEHAYAHRPDRAEVDRLLEREARLRVRVAEVGEERERGRRVDEDVVLQIKSMDVLHSFFLPHVRVKQDVVPGMKQFVWFRGNKSGVYDIVCAELCGWGHYKMRGKMTLEPREKFDAWLAQQYAEQERSGFQPKTGAQEND